MSETLESALRHERRVRKLGPNARCSRCGERNPALLHSHGGTNVCYQCRVLDEGGSGMEDHHIAGRHNSTDTIRIPANEHRILSEYQRDWPDRTLRNPDGSPLLKMSAWLRGVLDLLKLLIDRVLGRIPDMFDALDAVLCSLFGPSYWELPSFAACFGDVS